MQVFDVFVIGSGMAGMTAAHKCAAKGLKVGITDELPYGGTCALRGCDPKKVIIGTTEVADFAKRLHEKGLVGESPVSWSATMDFKQSFVIPVPSNMNLLAKYNI